jgi:ABC-type nickel/cobalt efflux system permease component RcnA
VRWWAAQPGPLERVWYAGPEDARVPAVPTAPHGPVLATILLGFLLGLRHALDADHLAAVATIALGRGGTRRAILTGVSWGVGHALTIGVVGGALIVFRVAVPERVGSSLELAVAAMLVALGAWALVRARRVEVHAHEHEHGGVAHAHLHLHDRPAAHGALRGPAGDPPRGAPAEDLGGGQHHPLRPPPSRIALRPLLVGAVHGLAGSAPLVVLVLATLPTLLLGLAYLLIFGLGSILGMGLMSGLLGAPLAVAGRRVQWLSRAVRVAAGLGSLLLGLVLAWRIVPGLL